MMKKISSILFVLILMTVISTSCGKDEPVNPDKTFTVNGVTFTMVEVEGGTFSMGLTAEQAGDDFYWVPPAHEVTLSSYFIGQTEVTQALWQAVMGSNPSHFSSPLTCSVL